MLLSSHVHRDLAVAAVGGAVIADIFIVPPMGQALFLGGYQLLKNKHKTQE